MTRYPRLSRSQFACPRERKYPLNTKKRAANAHARYNQKRTAKCGGGLERILEAERRFGIVPKKR